MEVVQESPVSRVFRDGSAKTLEVFTGGCDLCTAALRESLQIAEDWGFNIEEYKVDGKRAASLGIRSAPSIVIENKILFAYSPTADELAAALQSYR